MPDNIKIVIPKPKVKPAVTEVERFIKVLGKLEDRLSRVDKAVDKTGKKTGKLKLPEGGRGSRGRGPRLGSGPSGQNPGRGFLGGGTSGGAANIARAGGIGGPAAVALGQSTALASSLIALTATLVKAISLTSKFEEAMGEISRVSGLAGQDLKDFGTTVEDLASDLPVTTAQIFKLASAGANAGLSAEGLESFTRQMAKLAVILPSISDEQVRGILRVASLTDFPVERIGELNGALLNLQQTTKATLPQLIKLSQRVSQDVGLFGASTKEVTGLAATIADLGLQPERASTAIGRMTAQIKNLSSVGSKGVKRITDTFRDQTKAVGFLDLAMREPIKAIQLLSQESTDFGVVLDTIGISSGSKAGVINQNLLKNGDRWLAIQKEAKANGGLVDEQAASKMEELSSQWQIFLNKLDESAKTFGDKLSPAIVDTLKNFSFLIDKLTELGTSLFGAEENVGSFFDTLDERAKRTKGVFATLALTAETLIRAPFEAVSQARGLEEDDENNRQSDIVNDLTTGVDSLGRRILELRKEGNKLIIVDPQLNARRIGAIDDSIEALQKRILNGFKEGGVSVTKIDAAMKGLETTLVAFGNTDPTRALREELDILAQRAGSAKDAIDKLAKVGDRTAFELKIFDLTKTEKDLERIVRATDEAFTKNAPDILNNLQVSDFTREIDSITDKLEARGVKLDILGADGKRFSIDKISNDIKTVLSGDDFKSGAIFGGNDGDSSPQKLLLDRLAAIAKLLSTSAGVSKQLGRNEALKLDLLLKEAQKENKAELARISELKAPSLNLVDNAGAAVELLNQRILDNDLQQKQLAELEKQNIRIAELIRVTKQNTLQRNDVVTYSGGL